MSAIRRHNRNSLANGGDYDYLFKILLIGDAGVGKSSMLLRWADDRFFASYVCTIGIDFKIRTIELGGKRIRLQVWDTAGQERFRTITAQYFRNVHGVVVVFDLTKEETFRSVPSWFREINKHSTFPPQTVVCGNKCDLQNQIVVDAEEAKALADQHDAIYIETSARDATNVQSCFEQLVRNVLDVETAKNQRKISSSSSENGSFTVNDCQPIKKRRCC